MAVDISAIDPSGVNNITCKDDGTTVFDVADATTGSLGSDVSSPSVAVKATGVMSVSGSTVDPAQGAGNANPDGKFRYDASFSGYSFDLKARAAPISCCSRWVPILRRIKRHFRFDEAAADISLAFCYDTRNYMSQFRRWTISPETGCSARAFSQQKCPVALGTRVASGKVVGVPRWLVIGIGVALLLQGATTVRRDVQGFSLIYRAANRQGVLRWLADADTVSIGERTITVPDRHTTIRARVYAPLHETRQTVLLISGLQPGGPDEPRLTDLARKLAQTDVTVVKPYIPELSRFEITPLLTDRVEETALWLATASGLAPAGRVGLVGVSFGGGLAMVAAGRPSLRDHVSYVLSLGGYADLVNVLRYVCTTIDTKTSSGPLPTDYGVAIIVLVVARELVPPSQVAALSNGVRRFLRASYLDHVDKVEAAEEYAAVRALAATLPEPSATLLRYVSNRDIAHLGPLLLPYIGTYAGSPALSPVRSPLPSAPVFLLHGRDDQVIPASEARDLAARLQGHAPVRLLFTDLVTHTDPDGPAHVLDILQLADFWGSLLDE